LGSGARLPPDLVNLLNIFATSEKAALLWPRRPEPVDARSLFSAAPMAKRRGSGSQLSRPCASKLRENDHQFKHLPWTDHPVRANTRHGISPQSRL